MSEREWRCVGGPLDSETRPVNAGGRFVEVVGGEQVWSQHESRWLHVPGIPHEYARQTVDGADVWAWRGEYWSPPLPPQDPADAADRLGRRMGV